MSADQSGSKNPHRVVESSARLATQLQRPEPPKSVRLLKAEETLTEGMVSFGERHKPSTNDLKE